MSYPYVYTNLVKFERKLEYNFEDEYMYNYFRTFEKKDLYQEYSPNDHFYFIIKPKCLNEAKKKCIIILCRTRPNESSSSYILEGILKRIDKFSSI